MGLRFFRAASPGSRWNHAEKPRHRRVVAAGVCLLPSLLLWFRSLPVFLWISLEIPSQDCVLRRSTRGWGVGLVLFVCLIYFNSKHNLFRSIHGILALESDP